MIKSDLIVREQCLDAVRPFIGLKLIKIITGVRRCGKSYLLDMIGDEFIARGVSRNNIIYRLYTSVEVEDGFSKKDMYEELKSCIKNNKKYFLLLDEVQEVLGWEQTVNSLYENCDVDIYVTGSNSKLTAENISSYLSGRYIIIPTYTLSFDEYIKFTNFSGNDFDEIYKEYVRYGGFPLIAASKLPIQQAYQIADGIYHSIINKDIMRNHPIKDVEKFDRIVKFLMDNVGKTFSANSVSNYLKSQHREISTESIYNYIKWLKEAFIIYQCNRYDLQGKNILKTQEKYYLSDIVLRYAQFGYNNSMNDAALENIIYLELRRRGYDVYIGKNGDKEIDFIAFRQGEQIQIQATIRLPEGSDREIGNLADIKDYNHKYVVTTNRNDVQIRDGIKVIHVVDFLRMENW